MIEKIRERAKALLSSGEVKVVVGWREGRRAETPVPHFARTPDETAALIVEPSCRGGLAVWAPREAAAHPSAFVASKADVRALRVLVQEKQIPDANVRVIAFEWAAGVKTAEGHAPALGPSGGHVRLLAGERLGDFAKSTGEEPDGETDREVARILATAPAERWAYWRQEFDRCTRCYACRAACPMCYCDECVAEKNLPQWIETTASPRGNLAWNLIRAWHLAGRCSECGACERACPEGIALMVLNRMLAREVKEAFAYVAGQGDVGAAGVFVSFREDDRDDFIL